LEDTDSIVDRGLKNTVLLVTSISSFLVGFMISAVNVALPTIGLEFGMQSIELGWVQASYLLASVVMLVPSGRIGDIKGRKKVFLLGLIIYVISSVIILFPITKEVLLILRVAQGAGAGMIVSIVVALLTSTFPRRERGKVLGINTAVVYVGISLGPFLGGILTQNLGWRSIFWVNIPFGVLAIALSFYKLKGDWADAVGSRFDFAGAIVYGFALSSLMYGISTLSTVISENPILTLDTLLVPVLLVSIGVLSITMFILLELKSSSPILDVRLFKHNIAFAFSNFATLINYSATYALSFLLSIYLQLVKGIEPEVAGLLLIPMPVVQAVLSPFTGWLSDKISPRIVSSIGMGITAIGMSLFAFISNQPDNTFLIINLVFMGIGFSLFSSPNTNAIMCSVDKKDFGTASAMLSTMRQLGMVTSTFIATIAITSFVGGIEIAYAPKSLLVAGIGEAFVISAILCFIGVFLLLAGVTKDKSNISFT